jgi:hypothetical protein
LCTDSIYNRNLLKALNRGEILTLEVVTEITFQATFLKVVINSFELVSDNIDGSNPVNRLLNRLFNDNSFDIIVII